MSKISKTFRLEEGTIIMLDELIKWYQKELGIKGNRTDMIEKLVLKRCIDIFGDEKALRMFLREEY